MSRLTVIEADFNIEAVSPDDTYGGHYIPVIKGDVPKRVIKGESSKPILGLDGLTQTQSNSCRHYNVSCIQMNNGAGCWVLLFHHQLLLANDTPIKLGLAFY